MSNLLFTVLNMSLTGSVVICAVLLARACMKRLPKIYSYALWSVVLFRLLCPVSFTAQVSVLDIVEPEMQEASGNTSIVSYIPATMELTTDFVAVPAETIPIQNTSAEIELEQLHMTPTYVLALIWAAGAAGLMLYSIAQYVLLRRNLIGSIQLQRNVYLADYIDTAFVIGVLQPKIYIPSNLTEYERSYILAHERHHIRRLDQVIKLLAYLALCIHWFNPLVWLAFALAGKDMEMSCDEAVIKKLGSDIRADYSASLLRLATHRKLISGMPLAFGEGDTKSRVLNMAKWKKPAKWLAAACVLLCICVVAVCAFNPEEEPGMDVLTHRYSEEPVYTGIGDLFFTYPAGLASESREVDNWTREEELRRIRRLPNRNQWDQFFMDDSGDFGGCVGFLVPESREIRLEELNLPNDWKGLDYIAGSSSYPFAEMEYTLIKDGKDYIQLYLYTYSGHGYFLWFYTDQCDPAIKEAILESVELGNGSHVKTKTTYDEPISLGLFNMTIPKGYGYSRTQTVILEITEKDFWGNHTVLGCVTALPNPNLPMETEEELDRWVQALGIDMIGNGLSYYVSDDAEHGDVYLSIDDSAGGQPILKERHFLYLAGNIVYDVCLNGDQIDRDTERAILDSIWIKDSSTVPSATKWVTAAAHTSVQIGLLPEGYHVGYDRDRNLIFAWGSNAVGGVNEYTIPEGVYDPYDRSYFWLEEMGIPDFEDDSLMYTGGMTAGDNGWVAEFASNVPSGTPVTVHRRHTFHVVGNRLYDVWFDLMSISRDTAQALASEVHLPQPIPVEVETNSPEDIAFEKTLAVMDAVSKGSCHIVSLQKNDGYEGPSGYEKTFHYHEGNFLYTNRVLTEGENLTEVGAYYNRYAMLIVEDEWFTNEGNQGVLGDIVWVSGGEPADPESPWLGNRVWNRSFVTYMDTITDEDETCYMFRYDKPYADDPSYDPHYFVNFYFDHSGNFIKVDIQVNLFKDNGFTVTESIVSLDPYIVATEIDQEYFLASGKHLFVPAPSLNSSDTALERCKSELAHIQSCSQALVCMRDDGRDNGIIEYWKHENDWMTIQRHSGDNMIAYLCKDGSYYDNGEMHGDKIGARDDDGNVLWKAGKEPQSFHIPWLSRYQWNDENVHYLGTEQANGEISIQLRISEPFPGFEWGNPDYSVTMVFDESHLFLRAELSVNQGHVSESAFTEVETISSLWSVDVAERIDQEYQRAIR